MSTRRVITNFRASDFSGTSAAKTKKKAAPKAAPKAQDSNTVPEGTTAEVLKWVGEDVDRAREAKSVELESDSPRKSVLGALDSILAAEDDKSADDESDKDAK